METDVEKQLKERFQQLPKVVQDAISNIDVQKQLRSVSDKHKLHVDQWATLENEVMLTLLGFQDPSNLPTNIQNEVGIPAQGAAELAKDVSEIVFEPIRQELERQLEHPEAKEKEMSAEEAARAQILATEAPTGVVPATPPPPKPTEKAVRAPISSSYTARQASSTRKNVADDPYRESPL